MEVDFIIVGCGLAGIHFCELAIRHNKTVLVIDNNSQQSSTVAGGLYNPLVLKRFTPVWKGEEQLELVKTTYDALEKKLQVKLDYNIPVKRIFKSIEEQNNWFIASDNENLTPFLSTEIIKNTNSYIQAPFGLGQVNHTGRIDTLLLIQSYKKYLKSKQVLLQEEFQYQHVQVTNHKVAYNKYTAKHLVFAEGFGLKNNPFFNHLPLKGTKGELLTIYAPKLQIDYVLKGSVFLIPLEKDLYKVGATYEWEDKSNTTTEKGKMELLTKLKTVIRCPFEVVEQQAGIRPTVIDRKPLVGTHPEYKKLHVLNGLGTRGVMIAPYAAKALYNHIEHQIPLENEINSNRF